MATGKRQSTIVALSFMRLDKSSDVTLRRSLYACVREAILSGSLRAGARLPSTRFVAAELGVSRNTVADAFAQLVAEELLVSRIGSGTFVAATAVPAGGAPSPPTLWERASQRGRLLATRSGEDRLDGRPSVPFQPGLPAYDHFPFDVWARIAARIMRRPAPELLGYGPSAGYAPLRDVIAADVRARTGVACRAEQVIVVGGTSQALDLVCRLTLDPGDEVWIEDPSSLYVRGTVTGAGAVVVPVPVDDEGLDVAHGRRRAPHARLAHVTSAHQWPLGPAMSLRRRTELLQWADDADAWIVEDEYDGVFRHDGTAPPSLRSLDRADRVIAVGSFSLTIFPALRLGYLIAPPSLVDAFVAAKATADRHASAFEQAILAEFIFDGHYARHRKHMQPIYRERRDALIDRIAGDAQIAIAPHEAGLHVILPLPPGTNDVALSRAARAAGIVAPPLSVHYLGEARTAGLILGFGAGTQAALETAAARLCRDVLGGARPPRAALARDVPG